MAILKRIPPDPSVRGLRLGTTVALWLLFAAIFLWGVQSTAPARGEPMLSSAEYEAMLSGSEPYTIGAVLALSGDASFMGMPEGNTIQMLEDQINAQGGINGHPLHLIISDTQSDSAIARELVSTLITDHNVLAIIGPSLSSSSMNVMDVVQEAQVPLVSLASAGSIVEPVSWRQWVFKVPTANDAVVARQLDYLQCYGLDVVALMCEDTGYGEDGRNQWAAQAPAAGITTVITETFARGETDFEGPLTSILVSEADALLFWGSAADAAAMAEDAQVVALNIPILLSSLACEQEFVDLAEGAANGALAVCGKMMVVSDLPEGDPQKAVILQYMADYTDTYGLEPDSFGGHAWDATQLISATLGAAGANRADIRHGIEATEAFVGIGGVYDFSCIDHNGLTKHDLVIAHVVEEAWYLAETCEPYLYLPLILKNFMPRPLTWIDVHTHLNPGTCCGDLCGADLLVSNMTAAGISKIVLFPLRGGSDSGDVWDAYADYPDRIIPFRGPEGLDINDPSSLDLIHQDLHSYPFKGLGEIVVKRLWEGIDNPADHEVMLQLWALAAEHNIPVLFHMSVRPDAEDPTYVPPEWLAELEEALYQSPSTTFIWAHTGPSSPDVLRGMLDRHPNLYADLSGRNPVLWAMLGRGELPPELFIDGPEWIQLLEDYPDRFLFGTDVFFLEGYVNPTAVMSYVKHAVFSQLSDDTVEAISHENAERLLGLSALP